MSDSLLPSSRKTFIAAGAALAATSVLSKGAFAAVTLPPQDQRADADLQRVLSALAGLNSVTINETLPHIARELPTFADALRSVLSADGKPCVEPVAKVAHEVFAGPAGTLLVRIYTPAGPGPLPIPLYFHGGGFVIADLDTYDASARALANAAGAIVVSVAYRLAPQWPFPAAPQDAFTAYQWVLANAASIGGAPKRIAVTGESAGGNLATGVAIAARDKGIQLPVHQLLVYPVTVFGAKHPPASYAANYTTLPLSTPQLPWFAHYYLSKSGEATNPLASPLLANVKGLPPATIINADLDPLRDDGEAYANHLKSAGVPVTRTVYAGMTHEFFGMGAAVAKAQLAMQEGATALKASFAAH
ncbi:MAG: alpha/beta hydrolase [Candidatus Eremiobacteraeota bacterium]|nr:alpha/beta hydrolase [Candidatus Eremiobacteraeota bacterium]